MVSLQTLQPPTKLIDPVSSPARISFSSEFLDEDDFISICPNQVREPVRDRNQRNVSEFEFLSGSTSNMITADELISEGKLLPFSQTHNIEKLKNITMKTEGNEENTKKDEEPRISWFLDDDPSPRPPTCTVLWKELLKLRKQRPSSTLSPSSSTSSSSSRNSVGEMSSDERKGNVKEKDVKKVKKGLERTRSGSIRIRPVINLPICSTHGKNSSLPPLFPIRRVKLERL